MHFLVHGCTGTPVYRTVPCTRPAPVTLPTSRCLALQLLVTTRPELVEVTLEAWVIVCIKMGCICTRNSNRVRPILVSQLAPDNCSKLQVPEVENTTQRSIRRFFSPQIFRSVGRVCPQNAQFENQIGTSPEELWSEVDKGCHPSKKSHIARDQHGRLFTSM